MLSFIALKANMCDRDHGSSLEVLRREVICLRSHSLQITEWDFKQSDVWPMLFSLKP